MRGEEWEGKEILLRKSARGQDLPVIGLTNVSVVYCTFLHPLDVSVLSTSPQTHSLRVLPNTVVRIVLNISFDVSVQYVVALRILFGENGTFVFVFLI